MTIVIYIALVLGFLYCCTIIAFIIGLYLPAKPNNKELLSVSVVIAARNEEAHISGILDDLVQQRYPKNLLEIIIANDGSDDRTAKIVLDYAKNNPHVKLLTIGQCPPHFSPKKYALEVAVRGARGEIILATDADCRVGPNWIATMVRFFAPKVGFVIGFSSLIRKDQPQNFIERLQALDFLALMGVAFASCNLGLPLAASGQNLGYRREAFLAVDGYRRISHRVSGDDVLLMQLIRRLTNYKIVFAFHPESFATSEPQPSIRQFINQRKRWASNGSFQLVLNPLFFSYLLLVYCYNAILMIAALLAFFFPFSGLLILAFIIKALGEAAIVSMTALRFNHQKLLKYFPFWFIFQIPYVTVVGIWGSFGNFSWKGRRYSPTA